MLFGCIWLCLLSFVICSGLLFVGCLWFLCFWYLMVVWPVYAGLVFSELEFSFSGFRCGFRIELSLWFFGYCVVFRFVV